MDLSEERSRRELAELLTDKVGALEVLSDPKSLVGQSGPSPDDLRFETILAFRSIEL